MSTVESIARPRRNGERRRAPTASISKESPAITGVVEMVIRRPIRSEERFSRNAETDLVCRLLLEKKNPLRGVALPLYLDCQSDQISPASVDERQVTRWRCRSSGR